MPHTSFKKLIRYVQDIPINFVFKVSPNDARLVLETIKRPRGRVDFVFTHVSGGEFIAVYGMTGIIPELSRLVRRYL